MWGSLAGDNLQLDAWLENPSYYTLDYESSTSAGLSSAGSLTDFVKTCAILSNVDGSASRKRLRDWNTSETVDGENNSARLWQSCICDSVIVRIVATANRGKTYDPKVHCIRDLERLGCNKLSQVPVRVLADCNARSSPPGRRGGYVKSSGCEWYLGGIVMKLSCYSTKILEDVIAHAQEPLRYAAESA
ncbi:predicted protein [Aspergillus nidulans FGSC A4]|uniref:Uncharacterized protein n=1 Tax=Emericella nidulans (strain FGSC A4 / ATCC 38163 / CBS 112.46 / NRRL 194 / M139) TaxID=227321 RepID=Q5AT87_EMENI|nr:hypothetical protein [Aspergillus nidulans FGSC A4]EAA67115.1 predicted protein [Aspergillus nidulans FGSC A4]CBF80665.1 TPA: hypothetical protein ANIA_08493 [Aspergillus nidulans FGSC A4]|eukprot:XP_681762.1 predicted protein [Aspergillus nidulans FGSC A4]